MHIFILTSELTEKNGWGRYSLDVSRALKKAGVALTIAAHQTTPNTEFHVHTGLPKMRGYLRNYLTSFWYAWKFKKQVRECDLIHAFTERYSLIAFLLSKLTGKKYVITVHGTYGMLPYHMSFIVRWVHHLTLKSAAKVVCVSSYTKKLLQEKGLTNLVVINNGIAVSEDFSAKHKPFNERSDTLLTVGALKHRKGQHITLEAFSKIADTFPYLRYVLVGDAHDDDYYESLKKNAAAHGIAKRVSFVSGISDQELKEYYESAKLFVMTSITKGAHFEGFGLVYLEANAHGLPVIGGTDSGAEDAIQDGKTGILVPQNDPTKTAEAMSLLLSNDIMWSSLSKQAVKWAKDHDWDVIVSEYIDLYRNI